MEMIENPTQYRSSKTDCVWFTGENILADGSLLVCTLVPTSAKF